MFVPRLNTSERLRSHMTYRKFADVAPRLMLLESDYWLDGACDRAARRMGWEIRKVAVAQEGIMSRETIAELMGTLLDFRPDFILSINASGVDEAGLLVHFFNDLKVPFVTWFVDDPRTILIGRETYGTEHGVALTWERAYEPDLVKAGFGLVDTVALGVDDSIFNDPPRKDWPMPPTLIANSMTAQAARAWEWIAPRRKMADAITDAFERNLVNRANFGRGLTAMLGPETIAEWDEHERRHAELYLFIEGTRRVRVELAQALAPEGLFVAGDEDWKQIVPMALPYINYAAGLPNYYRQCAVNLNSTSIQMPNAVNQRVLDCPAAGGFLLTDAQGQLAELFDLDDEVAVYHNVEEARELLRHYAAHPEERFRIVEKAQRRVLGEHTYGHRLRHIVSLLKARFGNG